MNDSSPFVPLPQNGGQSALPGGSRLFLVSVLILFLELACIRWFPAHVLFLTFFTNSVLLASFLGMSLGCLATEHKRTYLVWTPSFLAAGVIAALGVEILHATWDDIVAIGIPASSQVIFFGSEQSRGDLAQFYIPVEVMGGFFFVLIALVFVGPGQELGRAFNCIPNRVQSYTINILGSLAGILLFAAFSWWELPPFWWFLPILITVGYLIYPFSTVRDLPVRWGLLAFILVAVSIRSETIKVTRDEQQHFWSPYYRVDFIPKDLILVVNQIGHQRMYSTGNKGGAAYGLPYLFNRDAGGEPFEDVLIIGAGSGNDVSRALQWNAKHVDAVEIDPTIQRLGAEHHPNQPYQDGRVTVHLDDGRNYLRSSERQYDLIIYALVDSLVLQSGYSNIRLESYLFTQQAFADVRRHLKPGGIFVMANYFRRGWLVARLEKGLGEVFEQQPLVFTLPMSRTIEPVEFAHGEYTLLFVGNTDHIRNAFEKQGDYWVSNEQGASPDSPNGFQNPAPEVRLSAQGPAVEGETPPWSYFGPARVIQPEEPIRTAGDDWPFLYLRRPMLPDLSLRSMAVMGGLALVMLLIFLPRKKAGTKRWDFDGRMFFLGAGFMLLETKAVVHMALLFGSTWMVNSVVFFGVLLMILAANLFVLVLKPQRMWRYYTGLFVSLGLMALIPLDYFLGMNRVLQVTGSCLLVFAPILFAGVIFAVSFSRSAEPNRAYGANIAGAMVGGLAENTSMLLGFQYLILVALAFYALSAILGSVFRRSAAGVAVPEETCLQKG